MQSLRGKLLQLTQIMSSSIQEITDRVDLWALCVHLSALQQKAKCYSIEQAQLAVQRLARKMQAEMPAELRAKMRIVPNP